jgi:hypothetical protein
MQEKGILFLTANTVVTESTSHNSTQQPLLQVETTKSNIFCARAFWLYLLPEGSPVAFYYPFVFGFSFLAGLSCGGSSFR